MTEYTVVAMNAAEEQQGTALLVADVHLAQAVDDLTEYWLDQQDEDDINYGIHCVVYEGSVRGEDGKPLLWEPGLPMTEQA